MRFSDERFLTPPNKDFVPRNSSRILWTLLIVYLIAFVMLFAANIVASQGGHLSLAAAIILIVVGALVTYIFLEKQRSADLVQSTEFLNALLVGAAGANYRFFLILRHDRVMMYSSYALRQLYPQLYSQEQNPLETLLDSSQMPKEDKERIYDALHHGTTDRFSTLMEHNEGQEQFFLTVSPLDRPSGYFVLRARDYVPARNQTAD